MAALILPSRRVVQPSEEVEVDWANPLTRGLVFADAGPQFGYRRSLGSVGNPFSTAAVDQVVSHQGKGIRIGSEGSQFYSYGLTAQVGPPLTFLSIYVLQAAPTNALRIFGNLLAASYGYGFAPNSANARLVLARSGVNTILVGRTHTVGKLKVDVGVVDATQARLYEEGTLTAGPTSHGGVAVAAGELRIGADNASNNAARNINFGSMVWSRALSHAEVRAVSENPWQLFRPVQRRIIVGMGAGGTGATAAATPATVTTTAPTATAIGAASASATPAQATATAAIATATGSASAQATPAAASTTPATGTATGAALAASAPASVQLTPATATASGESGASVEATATPAPITTAPATATATGSASAQATPAQVTTTAPAATAASGISASATLAAIGLMPATGSATGGAIASAIPAQIIIAPAQATATGSAWAYGAPAQISTTPATGSASEYIKPLYSEEPSAQFVAYPVEDHSVDYPLRLMAVNYPFDSNQVDFPLRALRVNYPKQ